MDAIVIIGAGEAGTRAAFALREAGFAGNVTLIGTEPHPPYERPPLCKPLEGAVRMKPICADGVLEAARISYRQGVSATRIDAKDRLVTLDDGRTLGYDRLLLATGAQPRKLTCPGAGLALDFRTHADARAIFSRADSGARIAIIGGGLIGMELAAVLRGKGLAISIIEAATRPLGRAVPRRLAERIYARHLEEGVNFHLGHGVSEITPEAVLLTEGGRVRADIVVSAIGVLPNVELAQTAGLATGNGILTDAFLRTSDPHIFAAGDCAAVSQPGGGHIRFESWRNARSQAEVAAHNILGANEAFAALPWFWSDQYDLGLQVAGQPQPEHQSVIRSLGDGELELYLQDGRLVAAAGLGVGNSVARDIKLAEMLIAAGINPDPAALADPDVNLKSLLKSARAA
ncbi:FAD-dependent oxidoreductase [Agrobacterium leguminum]|uniref:Anthranilate 1,2-dioxygenase system ferredoxin--NAD(+) reductase component n=1 Tax=Agrobacterium deltaense NCPPB 1641 TaxID=1183425 RepID=A0A1S7TSF2_9HYPH|nr:MULTISPECIES: FAD-dependent oxidoreductase [Agrobacterium]WFS69134.1 FAD-dependent oxidoreductase [Agrobacterium leguminum]CVI57534.1 Anthranilate 1,2-dioxygenase system ferredoxin--NAD(+) reductase component [Agrobacterium deltaense NCPPB 1641]